MTAEPAVEWCEFCDLPRYSCQHRDLAATPAFPYRPTVGPKTLTPWIAYGETEAYRSQWQTANKGQRLTRITCDDDHGKPPGAALCHTCSDLFRACLADVPALVHDLGLAQARITAFAERGARWDDPPSDESPLPYDPHASDALNQLGRAATGAPVPPGVIVEHATRWLITWPAVITDHPEPTRLVAAVSGAVLHGFRVVDRPPDLWFFGPCPGCGRDLYDERDVDVVRCRACTYQATRDDHVKACLDAGDDRWLTVTELVGAITTGGETVTRDQINGWIRRHGLPREQRSRPTWRNGALVPVEVWVYRLGDVRDMAAQASRRREGDR